MGGGFSKNDWTVYKQGFPPKPKFSVDQIPDLTGRVMLVTGTSSGLYRVRGDTDIRA